MCIRELTEQKDLLSGRKVEACLCISHLKRLWSPAIHLFRLSWYLNNRDMFTDLYTQLQTFYISAVCAVRSMALNTLNCVI
jgi:hypothetical protein